MSYLSEVIALCKSKDNKIANEYHRVANLITRKIIGDYQRLKKTQNPTIVDQNLKKKGGGCGIFSGKIRGSL